jgi:hypothetical protein
MRSFHKWMTAAWFAVVPVALVTGWVESIVFISACSIYANAASHFSAWQAARAEDEASNG